MKKISTESLNSRVYAEIKKAIMTGHFKPGDKLTERSLVEALGTSQMPVRVALNRLHTEGALSKAVPSGTMIIPSASLDDFVDWMDLRSLLESKAVVRAAPNISEQILDKLIDTAQRLHAANQKRDINRHLKENFAFKRLIYQQSGSETLCHFIDMLWLRVGPFLRNYPLDQTTHFETVENEERIIALLKANDGKAAAKIIKKEIAQTVAVIKTREKSAKHDA